MFSMKSSISCTIIAAALLLSWPQGSEAQSSNETAEAAVKSEPIPSPDLLPEALIALPPSSNNLEGLARTAILVGKKERTLRVFEFNENIPREIYHSPTDLGKKDGDKERTNDHRTPVGLYFLTGRKSPPQIPFDLYGKLAFETNYPNLFDRLAGKTGSGIWLHAVPDSVPLTRGSRGCVVVRNDSIEKVAKFVETGQTPILILPEITLLPKEQYLSQQSTLLSEMEAWRKAWETQDLDKYFSYYAPSFKLGAMDLKGFKRYKKNLKSLYSKVQVLISTPVVVKNKDQMIIRFMQKYISDKHQDFGEKTIIAQTTESGSFRIIAEDWSARDEAKFGAWIKPKDMVGESQDSEPGLPTASTATSSGI